MTTLAVPAEPILNTRNRKWLWMVVALAAVVLVVVTIFGRSVLFPAAATDLAANKYFRVVPVQFERKVHKDGELQAVNNIDIVCMVEGTNTITELVKEGAFVNPGDVLVRIDSSAIRQKIDDYSLDLQRVEGEVATAKNALEFQKSQNEATLEAATVDVELGRLAIQQYVEGTYPQDLRLAETALKMAKIKQANKEDDFKQIKELHLQGFVNLADVKAAELDLETVRNEVAKAEGELTVLTKYTHPMMLQGKQSYLKQAEQKLARTRVENGNALNKAMTSLATQEAQKRIFERRLAEENEQLEYCTIKAPQAGLVVYNNNSYRDSSQPIAEGTLVRERQGLLRLPDTSSMKAVVRINESQVINLSTGQRATVKVTGMKDPIGATVTRISPVSDSSSKYFSPDTREYPVELVLDWTPPSLKPGIGVEVEVLVQSIPNALAVPLAALYSAGPDAYVFTRTPNGVEPRKVMIGVANDTHVVVNDGLSANEEVVLLTAGQGRDLLDKAGIKVREEERAVPDRPDAKKADARPEQAAAGERSGGDRAGDERAEAGREDRGEAGNGERSAMNGSGGKIDVNGSSGKPARRRKGEDAGRPGGQDGAAKTEKTEAKPIDTDAKEAKAE